MTKDEVIRNIIRYLKISDKTSIYSPGDEVSFAIELKTINNEIKVSLGRYANGKTGYLIYNSKDFNKRYQLNSIEVLLIKEIMSKH